MKRDDLALAMIAAWCNVPVDKLPPEFAYHTCEATRVAWNRVADAARRSLFGDAHSCAPAPQMGAGQNGQEPTKDR